MGAEYSVAGRENNKTLGSLYHTLFTRTIEILSWDAGAHRVGDDSSANFEPEPKALTPEQWRFRSLHLLALFNARCVRSLFRTVIFR